MSQIPCRRRCAVTVAIAAAAALNAASASAQTSLFPGAGPAGDAVFVDDSRPATSGPVAELAASWENAPPMPAGAPHAVSSSGTFAFEPHAAPIESHHESHYGASCDDCSEAACDCFCDPCPPRRPRSFVFGEALYLRPTGGDVTHAQQQNGIGGAGTVPFGRVASIMQDYEPGFRVGIGCCLEGCSQITASYTFFEAAAVDSVALPVITGGGGAVGSLVHHPNASITASTGPVDATQSIDFQLADVLFRDVIRDFGWLRLNYSLGGQFGQLEQDFYQSGNFSGGSAGDIDTTTSIDFNGGGIKGGLDGERHICRGVNVYGKTSAALMSGRFKADYSMVNTSTAVDLAIAEYEDNRIVPQVEFEVGVSLNTKNERVRVAAGYQFQHWFNAVTTSDFIDAVQADNYTDLSDTLSFDGLTARIEARW